MALAGKPVVVKGKVKILKKLISCFLFSSLGSPHQDFNQLLSQGWARGKLRYLFLVFFQQSRVAGSGLAPAGKPGVGKVKGKIIKILISCFLFSREAGGGPGER